MMLIVTKSAILAEKAGQALALRDTPERKNATHAQGAEPQAMTPEKFSSLLKTDCQGMKDVVKQAGLTIE